MPPPAPARATQRQHDDQRRSPWWPSRLRALADSLAVTEPSVSRMVATLANTGLLTVKPDPAGGNRRQIALTDAGRTLVDNAGTDLIQRLTELVESSGVPFDTYLAHTRRLNAALDGTSTRPMSRDTHHSH